MNGEKAVHFFLKQAYHGNVQCISIQKKFVNFLHCSVMRRGKDTTARVRSSPPPPTHSRTPVPAGT